MGEARLASARLGVQPLISKLSKALGEKRLAHSVRVMETARELALIYGADAHKAEVAGLLHDSARDMADGELLALCPRLGIVPTDGEARMPKLLHGPVGAKLLRDVYGVRCAEIEDAVCWHTTGKANMALLTKIVFAADAIEPGRVYEGVEAARDLAFGRRGAQGSEPPGPDASGQGARGVGARGRNASDCGAPGIEAPSCGAPGCGASGLDEAVLRIIAGQLAFLLRGNSYIHPSTVNAWNYLALTRSYTDEHLNLP